MEKLENYIIYHYGKDALNFIQLLRKNIQAKNGLYYDGNFWIYGTGEKWANELGISDKTYWQMIKRLKQDQILKKFPVGQKKRCGLLSLDEEVLGFLPTIPVVKHAPFGNKRIEKLAAFNVNKFDLAVAYYFGVVAGVMVHMLKTQKRICASLNQWANQIHCAPASVEYARKVLIKEGIIEMETPSPNENRKAYVLNKEVLQAFHDRVVGSQSFKNNEIIVAPEKPKLSFFKRLKCFLPNFNDKFCRNEVHNDSI